MSGPTVLRYAAFTLDPSGGNPAGVVVDADLADVARMQDVAREVGYSETAFVGTSTHGGTSTSVGTTTHGGTSTFVGTTTHGATTARAYSVRYFSPVAEVPFCGHATIATAVALAHRDGPGRIVLQTQAGEVAVSTSVSVDGAASATLTSVEPYVEPVGDDVVADALTALRWQTADLDPGLPPRTAFAGARHLILAAATRERLADLDYAFDELADVMRTQDWTTVQLVWREDGVTFHVRDPFPVGGVVEDPATGAAAAALGAYLRDLALVTPPARLTLHQGDDLGRPSVIVVDLVPADLRVRVTGHAVPIP